MSVINIATALIAEHKDWQKAKKKLGFATLSHKHAPKVWSYASRYARYERFNIFVQGNFKYARPHVKPSPVKKFPFNWDGMNMWLTNRADDALHEIAHHMVCMRKRPAFIDYPEYALGSGPGTQFDNPADRLREMTVKKSLQEEYQVCLLAGFMIKSMDICPHGTWDYTSTFEGGSDETVFRDTVNSFKVLNKLKLIDTEGNFKDPLDG